MKGRGPRYERETIIILNEQSEEATIWTASLVIYRRLLKRLGLTWLVNDEESSAEFKFPKKFLSLPRAKKTATHGFHTNPRQMAEKTAEKSETLSQSPLDKEKSPNPRPAWRFLSKNDAS
jgi:hypothetical protein